jgi:hypothetical protein
MVLAGVGELGAWMIFGAGAGARIAASRANCHFGTPMRKSADVRAFALGVAACTDKRSICRDRYLPRKIVVEIRPSRKSTALRVFAIAASAGAQIFSMRSNLSLAHTKNRLTCVFSSETNLPSYENWNWTDSAHH